MMKHAWFLVLCFILSPLAFASDVSIEFEDGLVTLTPHGFQIPADIKKDLESQIFAELADRGVQSTTIELKGPAIEKVAKSFQHGDRVAKQNLLSLLQSQIRSKRNEPMEVSDQNARVFFGGHLVVKANEHLGSVVVLGGDADIYGTVDKLIQLGGHVQIHSGAAVLGQIVQLGGDLEAEDQSQVTPFRTRLRNLFSGAALWNPLGDYTKSLSPWTLTLFVWLFMIIIGTITQRLFPNYYVRVQSRMLSHWFTNFFWSFFALVLMLAAGLLFLISLLGIPLIPVLVLFYYFCYLLAQVHLAAKIGSVITVHRVALGILIGLVALHFTENLPFMGMFYKILIAISFGSVFREMGFSRRGVAS